MAYAVIKTGGKQYRVQQGDKLDVENLNLDEGTVLEFAPLLVGEGADIRVGAPVVDGASVQATVLNNYRGKKGIAFKFKRRKGFHKTKGYRRALTTIEINSIA
jgi:large subunit ribosomal protein L21